VGFVASEYRNKANELLMQARVEANPDVKATLLQLSQGYAHLAELTEKKAANAPIVVEPPADAPPAPEQIPEPKDSSEA
jgi:hypothetical protein